MYSLTQARSPRQSALLTIRTRALNVSTATVGREQRMAEAWLYRELNRESS